MYDFLDGNIEGNRVKGFEISGCLTVPLTQYSYLMAFFSVFSLSTCFFSKLIP